MQIAHATNMETKDNLDIELTSEIGTNHMDTAHCFIGDVSGSVKWRIGSPDPSGSFVIHASGWGIRENIERALDRFGGRLIAPEISTPPENPPSFEEAQKYKARKRPDSAVVLGDSCSWAS